jgi:hypothetical protein
VGHGPPRIAGRGRRDWPEARQPGILARGHRVPPRTHWVPSAGRPDEGGATAPSGMNRAPRCRERARLGGPFRDPPDRVHRHAPRAIAPAPSCRGHPESLAAARTFTRCPNRRHGGHFVCQSGHRRARGSDRRSRAALAVGLSMPRPPTATAAPVRAAAAQARPVRFCWHPRRPDPDKTAQVVLTLQVEPGSAGVASVDLGVPLAARPCPERPVVRRDLGAAV